MEKPKLTLFTYDQLTSLQPMLASPKMRGRSKLAAQAQSYFFRYRREEKEFIKYVY